MRTEFLKQILRRRQGFSLTEIIATLGILGVLGSVGVSFVDHTYTSMKRQEQAMTRHRLMRSLINLMGMPATIRGAVIQSGSGTRIHKCVRGTGPSGPCVASLITPIELYLPHLQEDPSSSAILTSGKITGTPAQPMRYSLEGDACQGGAGVCPGADFPLSISTEFDAICPPPYDRTYGVWPAGVSFVPAGITPLTACSKAHYIRIRYRFEASPGAPANFNFAPTTGIILVEALAVNSAT